MWTVLSLLLVATVIPSRGDLPLPSYVKACARSNPKFDDCVLQHGRDALPYIVRGDRKYRIPVMDPVKVTEIKIQQGPKQAGFTLKMNDVSLMGLKDAVLQTAIYNLKNNSFRFSLDLAKGYLTGKYEIGGRILVLPIKGKGDMNVTIDDSVANFYGDYKVENNRAVVNSATSELIPSNCHMHFTNLFGGDKVLGKQMNQFMNENWREVMKDFAPTIADVVGQIVVNTLNFVLAEVPYDIIFPYE